MVFVLFIYEYINPAISPTKKISTLSPFQTDKEKRKSKSTMPSARARTGSASLKSER